jgi:hypothetical protein
MPPPIHDNSNLQDDQDLFDSEQARGDFEGRMAKLNAIIRGEPVVESTTAAPKKAKRAVFLKGPDGEIAGAELVDD